MRVFFVSKGKNAGSKYHENQGWSIRKHLIKERCRQRKIPGVLEIF